MNKLSKLQNRKKLLEYHRSIGKWDDAKAEEYQQVLKNLDEQERRVWEQVSRLKRKQEAHRELMEKKSAKKEKVQIPHEATVIQNYREFVEREKHFFPKMLRDYAALIEDQKKGGDHWSVGKYNRLMELREKIRDIKNALAFLDAHESPYKEQT